MGIKIDGDYVGHDKVTNDTKIFRWIAGAFVAACAAFAYATYYVATMETDTEPEPPETQQIETNDD